MRRATRRLSLEWGGLKTDLRWANYNLLRRRISASRPAWTTISRSSLSIRAATSSIWSTISVRAKRAADRQAGIGFIPDDDGQCLDVGDPDWSNDAQLAHMSAQGVDRLGSLADEQIHTS